jgi:hypothetical protein
MIPFTPIKIITYMSYTIHHWDFFKDKFPDYLDNNFEYNIEIYQIRPYLNMDIIEYGIECLYYVSDDNIHFQYEPYNYKNYDRMIRNSFVPYGTYENAYIGMQGIACGISSNNSIQIGNLLFMGSDESQFKEDWINSKYDEVIDMEKYGIAENNEVR